MYSLTCIQPGGGDDHADQRKALRTQSMCSRSMVSVSASSFKEISCFHWNLRNFERLKEFFKEFQKFKKFQVNLRKEKEIIQ